jgi:hypothetical protein
VSGYEEAWQQHADSSLAGRALLRLYNERSDDYRAAGTRDFFRSADPEIVTFSEISLKFGDYLLTRSASGGAEAEGVCRAMALSLADTYWREHLRSAEELFRRAQLSTPGTQ